MLETGKIDAARARRRARSADFEAACTGRIIELDAPYVAEMVRAEMVRRLRARCTDRRLCASTTTVDSRLQQAAADAAVWRAMLEYERRHGYRGPLEQRRQPPASATRPRSPRRSHAIPARGSLLPAMVTSVAERSAPSCAGASGTESTLEWDDFAWARPALRE